MTTTLLPGLSMDSNQAWDALNEEFNCTHEQTRHVKFVKSNGVVVVRKQCEVCGYPVCEVPKAGFDLSKLPFFDQELQGEWGERRQARGKELHDQLEQERTEEWFKKYNEYLQSQHWYDLRQRVLERDNHLCQACLKRKATQAHHLSYELYKQLGYSAAFELVSICYSCHAKIHPHLAEAQHELSLYSPYLDGMRNGHK